MSTPSQNLPPSEPVTTPGRFLGPSSETRHALEDLDKLQSVAVVGPAGIGKTALLFHVADPQVRMQYRLAEKHVFVYLNCHILSECDRRECCLYFMNETIRQMEGLERVERAIQESRDQAIKSIQELPFQGLQALFTAMRHRGVSLVLMLDNYESLARNPRVEDDFFSGLRSLGDTPVVAYLVASRQRLIDLERIKVGSPFWNIFQTIRLGLLSPEESRALIITRLGRANAEVPESAIKCILELSAHDRYRLHKVVSIALQVWRAHGGCLPEHYCDEITRRFEQDGNHTAQS